MVHCPIKDMVYIVVYDSLPTWYAVTAKYQVVCKKNIFMFWDVENIKNDIILNR